ncbi:GntR family transcriptional regulator (plasmid) [Ensifer adhaerens]|uniref:GntR family transcriptional regulator n=2 Tax=Sinorhizobium/Ensifer group TaxID=227292 RepID=A0ABY8HUX0_ENSAD|nr:GntR family transcriptional regulator [Ensifer adhaerens]KQZ50191.1 GntR family transcriptional regulator [Ensifer sp. Root558]KSV63256.1 GntR family transcriptional regulator [Sinorhizobium sp. GW3]MBD9496193.1 GntR family transcriptional regulator [Ensifer sp. ENS01]MBD9569860.1 GntR family transcriptional regulator [Ensifer sp. ENS08]SFH47393.1 DNA-binding transcriptional regulator, GntR family [Ensifer sp. OV372]
MRSSQLAQTIANEISLLVTSGELTVGDHVKTQQLADRFGVSRSPVREAMEILAGQGLLEQKENRGFFVKEPPGAIAERVREDAEPFEVANDYQRLAEDWLTDRIPAEVTEQTLRERYELTKSQVNDVLMRATREGWAERKQGYGWRFLPVAKTPEAFEQIYRFRMLIEPAAMLEPEFSLDRKIIDEQRRIQMRMLETDIERLPAERLLHNGALFHEELIKMSNNPFFHISLVRVNRMRRLLEYRSRVDRSRTVRQCQEHLEILDLLERGEVVEASYAMRRHLGGALSKKSPITWSWSHQAHEKDNLEK